MFQAAGAVQARARAARATAPSHVWRLSLQGKSSSSRDGLCRGALRTASATTVASSVAKKE